jgi:serine protease Do
VKRVAPAVVKITTETKAKRVSMRGNRAFRGQQLPPGFEDNPLFRQFFGAPDQIVQPPQSGLGSGVIISPDGYIETNNHVVEGADTVTVALTDGREFEAKVVGRDPQTDIAVIKVDAKELPSVTFADTSKVEVGDRVLAIGNPFGIGAPSASSPTSRATRTSSRPMRRSIRATPAARSSTPTAASSASTPRSSRAPAASRASASPCPPTWSARSPTAS